ncbi:hypothetical protein VOLCADRAFT_107862 [Volvox carteri f. nagariensis]|uniref:Uncharacterized protein n=1 Tax=Volvox carteri f. nagariensis TaxID=3068 RepID=D8UGX2_VOLCA|nr:uncharacterized protein VOLCADRAFT_107862 [Volvox carteri f. nagariensis]EFJ41027.1 hypothetical protein VOLCADRAFT_107862 [Volvox carteri f. nagariensis]|eukprot:XP_002957891.1 hypothetical protein VOLCADRAFT_107862 [Volvox carteri f. nagariensis]
MEEHGKEVGSLSPPTTRTRDSQASPAAILTIALASGIGYCSWKLWKRWQDGKKDERDLHPAGSPRQENATKSRSKGSSFTFDKQPKSTTANVSSSSSTTTNNNSNNRRPSRQDQKPKSQKQLRKEAKQAKKAARELAARDAEGAALAATIAKRAKDLGLGQQQQPEPQKQYYVDYEGVTKAYDKIVEWQQTGKKKF